MLCCILGYSQEPFEFKILDKDFAYTYDEINTEFGVCVIFGGKECKYVAITGEGQLSGVNKITERTKTFFREQKFGLLTNKISIKQIEADLNDIANATTDYSKIEIEFEPKGLLEDEKVKDTIYVKEAGKALYFLIEAMDDFKFQIEAMGTLKVIDSFDFQFNEPLTEKKDEFIQKVRDELRNKLEAGKQEILTSVKEHISSKVSENLNRFYENTISKSGGYTVLTTEALTLKDNDEKKNFNFKYQIAKDKFYLRLCAYSSDSECPHVRF